MIAFVFLVAGTPDNYRDEPVSAAADMSPTSYQQKVLSCQYLQILLLVNNKSDQ